ncbi:hypothetical protein Acsp02_12030 [Actinoplanes sp. NBRC 103695]|nr:hypothetical protein Acsp02_12030 [Actinoplanes sp. NBRC 103695]
MAQPFTEATAAALRRRGAAVLIAGAASELVRTVAGFLLAATVVPAGARTVMVDYTTSICRQRADVVARTHGRASRSIVTSR